MLFLADLTRPKRNFLDPVDRMAQRPIASEVSLCKGDLLTKHFHKLHYDFQFGKLFW